MAPSESDSVTGFAPRSSSFPTVYCETLPLPETRQILPFNVSLRVFSISSALAAAHWQGGERILEDLFERQEFQNAEIHRGMEAQSTFIGADGAVHLDTEAAVNLHFALVVKPGHAEHQDSLGLRDPFQDLGFVIFGVAFQHGLQ